ncbi:MAG: OadG family protein [Candidatus Hydrogenedentales bacterium]
MIMVAGIATVFVALVVIIAMLKGFHVIFGKRLEKKRPELAPLPEIHSHTAPPAPSPAKTAQPGGELVAAITAAISAATGKAPTAFLINSISASSETGSAFNTPIWGQIERLTRK